MEEDKLLTAKEAAAYLGLSPKWGFTTVQKLVRKGDLVGGRVGDLHCFRKRDLDDYAFKKRS